MFEFNPVRLAEWSGGRWTRPPAVAPRRVIQDTRALQPGDLYLAIAGARFDGHAFVKEACARGAAGAVVSAAWAGSPDAPPDLPLLVVPDPRRALTDMARGHRATFRGRLIGVTGSVGKSTSKEMVAAVLAAQAPTVSNPGNWNNDIGLPLSLLAADPAAAYGVFELGMNHPGELDPLCRLLRPQWGVMARVGPVHLEFFATEEAIAEEKATLLRHLPSDGLAVLGADEPWFERLRRATPCRFVTVSLTGAADYRGQPDPRDPCAMEVTGPGFRRRFRLPQPGLPSLRNALRAVAVGIEAGLAPDAIAAALSAHRPPAMRWEEREAGGVRWINDAYNANAISMGAALDTFAAIAVAGRRWVVLGGMRELGIAESAAHAEIGRAVAAGPWAGLVVLGERGGWIADAAQAAGLAKSRIGRCGTAAEAADWLRGRLAPGDAVLLKGSRAERVEDVLTNWSRTRGA